MKRKVIYNKTFLNLRVKVKIRQRAGMETKLSTFLKWHVSFFLQVDIIIKENVNHNVKVRV